LKASPLGRLAFFVLLRAVRDSLRDVVIHEPGAVAGSNGLSTDPSPNRVFIDSDSFIVRAARVTLDAGLNDTSAAEGGGPWPTGATRQGDTPWPTGATHEGDTPWPTGARRQGGTPWPTGGENGVRRASVLVPLFRNDSGPGILLVKRSRSVRLHKGEICFPGGQIEESDRDFLETALRETEEEIGLSRRYVEILGRLPTGITAVSSYLVVPYVGVIPYDPSRLTPQPSEVAEVLWVPVSEFLDEESLTIEYRRFSGVEVPVYFYRLRSGAIVWGLTARIIHDLLTRIRSLAE
jgi:8-oxo-dGTP pyrophosphatase MutT (NUDIX family)